MVVKSPQSPGARRSPLRMGSGPSETGADPGAAAGELEDGARRGRPFRPGWRVRCRSRHDAIDAAPQPALYCVVTDLDDCLLPQISVSLYVELQFTVTSVESTKLDRTPARPSQLPHPRWHPRCVGDLVVGPTRYLNAAYQKFGDGCGLFQ